MSMVLVHFRPLLRPLLFLLQSFGVELDERVREGGFFRRSFRPKKQSGSDTESVKSCPSLVHFQVFSSLVKRSG